VNLTWNFTDSSKTKDSTVLKARADTHVVARYYIFKVRTSMKHKIK